jgi:cytochrome b involved in lipid metabolism
VENLPGRSPSCEEPKERPSVKTFTWEELAKLNDRHNGHVAIRNKVYDVSKFIKHHPGGVDQIMYGVGRDVTQIFESYHSFSTHRVLEKFYVGELITNEYPWFPKPSKFYVTLKTRVENYFKENNIDPKIDYWMFARYILFILSSFIFLAGAVS